MVELGLAGALIMSSYSGTQVGEAATILNVVSPLALSSGGSPCALHFSSYLIGPNGQHGPTPHLGAWKRRAGMVWGEVLMTTKHLEFKDYGAEA